MPEITPKDYLVKSPLLSDGKEYGIDDQISLTPDIAGPLLALGVLAAMAEEQAGDPGKIEKLAAAIATLDPANPAHFTADGKPQVPALVAIVGGKVTAAERDEAFILATSLKLGNGA